MTFNQTRLLAWFTFFPIVVTLVTELNKSVVVWHFRLVDLVDLIVLAPFYFVILFALNRTINPSDLSAKWSVVGWIVLFLYGHAMHVTANSINTFITEVHAYREIIPDDAYDLIYFLDEDLSHFLIFGSLVSLLMTWCYAETPKSVSGSLVLVTLLGLVEGMALAIAMIEATKPYLTFVAAILMWIGLRHLKNRPLEQYPFFCYVFGISVSLLITPLVYYLIFGNLMQPSQL